MCPSSEKLFLEGIRNPGELSHLKKELNAIIVGINAPKHLRQQWYLERAQERGEDNPKRFFMDAERDLGKGEKAHGQQVSRCLKLADFIIVNNQSKQTLIKKFKKRLAVYLGVDLRTYLSPTTEGGK